MKYSVFKIQNDKSDSIEQLGTKEKFWFYNEDKTIKLFKIGRPGTGENWSEKVASELAKLLELPCAEYEFAVWNGKEGVTSQLFVPQNGRLIHGNEILAKVVKDYRMNNFYKVREYKISTVIEIIKRVPVVLPLGYKKNSIIQKPLDMFVGYLMFDCWISNPDRHHENWGFVFDVKNKTIHLAPTYDHASGLGCRVLDKERSERLITNDKYYNIEAFVKKAKSAFYGKGLKHLKTIEVFITVAKQNKEAANFWLTKLEGISPIEIKNIFAKIPNELISEIAVEFAMTILKVNKKRLLDLREGF